MLMSLQPRAWPEPAPEVAAAVRATYRRRQPPLPVTIRDRLGELFPDGAVAAPVRARGRPGRAPGRVAGRVGAGHGAADGRDPDRPAGRRGGAGQDLVSRVVAAGLEQRALDLLLAALSWRLPASATKRAALAATYGARRSSAAPHGVRRQGTGLAARAA